MAMLETVQRLMEAGVGALSITRERAEKIFDEMVRRGQTEKTGREQFVKDLVDAAGATRSDLEELVAGQVHKVMVRLNLPTREDLARLEAKLDELLKREC
jgi:poly(hydroxyalkanoate) granule-associated protein